ncbi:hypothetical protein F3G14_18620, partial [Acinetobacter baumannii]
TTKIECLYVPGLHEVLMFSIHKSDMDLRKVLYQNIVLSGGSTLFRGFGDRLLHEIRRLAPKDMKIRVSEGCRLGNLVIGLAEMLTRWIPLLP